MRLVSPSILISQTASRTLHEPSVEAKHERWMAEYGKKYMNSAEKEYRLRIFLKNLKLVESFNSEENKPYKLKINEFADQTDQEVRISRNGYARNRLISSLGLFRYENVSAVPSSIYWRKKGAVTPVANQEQCGNIYSTLNLAAYEK